MRSDARSSAAKLNHASRTSPPTRAGIPCSSSPRKAASFKTTSLAASTAGNRPSSTSDPSKLRWTWLSAGATEYASKLSSAGGPPFHAIIPKPYACPARATPGTAARSEKSAAPRAVLEISRFCATVTSAACTACCKRVNADAVLRAPAHAVNTAPPAMPTSRARAKAPTQPRRSEDRIVIRSAAIESRGRVRPTRPQRRRR